MKRLAALLIILLVLLATAACDVDSVVEYLQDSTETTEDASDNSSTENGNSVPDTVEAMPQTEASAADAVEAASSTDADVQTNDSENQDEEEIEEKTDEETGDESDGQLVVDFTTLNADDCIEDAWPEEGVLPHITLDCQGAASINAAIDEKFTAYADDPMCVVYYQYFKNDNVLSILMVLDYQADYKLFTPYNLDLSTGEEMTSSGLMSLFGISRDDMAALELQLLGEEFTYQYGGMESSDPDFYQEQYDRTTDSSNADTDRLWIGGDGQLYFVGRIYALVGSDSYEYIMGSGLML